MVKTYKDLTPEEIEYVKHVYYLDVSHREKMDIMHKKFGIGERTTRKWWLKFNLQKGISDLPPQLKKAQDRSLAKDTKVLLVTSAQNKTSINSDFFTNLLAYQDYIQNKLKKKCEIVVIPARYRNPTSNVEDKKIKAQDWWADEIEDYLFYGKVNLGDVLISADSRIAPTAKDPLTGYEILASENHLILGHSKIHFKTLPRLRKEPLRSMCTTGYMTAKNYSKSKAGETSFENHSYGFVVVELRDDNQTCYIPRNVKVTQEGSFTDIAYFAENGEVSVIDESLGLCWGDIHHAVICEEIVAETHNLIRLIKPEKHVLHDVLDASSVNPPESEDMFIQRLKITQNKHLIEDEIEQALDFVENLSICCGDIYLSESNHDIFIDRHINKGNWKNDLHNSPAYLKLAYIQQTEDLREHGNIFGYLVNERFGDKVKYIKMGDSLKIGGYECGQHGDYGSNGSKGQVKGFSRLNVKMVHGHSHSPAIFNNVVCVGVTCSLEQYYNRKGFSSWAHAHCIVHKNNKNQLIVFTDDFKISGLLPKIK